MKRNILIKTIALLLFVGMMIPAITACHRTPKKPNDTTEIGPQTYPYFGDKNLGDATYNILNCNRDMWGMLCYVSSRDMNGDEINDEIYRRTMWVEEQLRCELVETNIDIYALGSTVRNDAFSGTYSYAAAYVRSQDALSGIVDGTHGQLDGIQSLHFDEDYWTSEIMEASSLNNRNYIATSDAHLMGFEGTWCIFFNVNMLEANGVELPYNMVRDGTWTLDRLIEISRNISTLNGDESWTWDENGNSVYGYTTIRTGVSKLLYGIGAQYGSKNINDMPYLTCEDESFYNRAQDLAKFVSDLGPYLYSKGIEHGKFSYLQIFMNGRAAFLGAEIQQGALFRSSDIIYGVLPYPKYNVDQEEYRSSGLDIDLAVLTISSGYPHKEDIGLIMDALSYNANKSFEEIYYSRRLQYKNNVSNLGDNIEMLNLIRATRTFDPLVITGLSGELWQQVIYSIADGGTNISSVVQQYKGYSEQMTAQLRRIFQAE